MSHVISGLFAAASVFIVVFTVLKHKELDGLTMTGFFFMSAMLGIAAGMFLG